jgi:hypothetical protein
MLDRDCWVLSPEIFLAWPADDLVAIVARVFLHPATQIGFSALASEILAQLGRWRFYLLISKLRFFQSLFDKPGVSKEALTDHSERIGDVEFWKIATRLQSGTAMRLLYMCVLGRGCDSNETESWVRRLREGTSIHTVLLDFLASAEYRRSFPDQFMSDVEAWARKELAMTTVSHPRAKPQAIWPVEQPLRFSEDAPVQQSLLGTNWYRREPHGRWSNGKTADFRFVLPEGANGQGAILTLRLRVAGTKITGRRHIVAHCNRKEVAALHLDDDAPHDWAIPLPLAVQSRQVVDLLLVSDQDFTPATAGESNDKRSLGLLLMEGRLTFNVPARPAGQSVAGE